MDETLYYPHNGHDLESELLEESRMQRVGRSTMEMLKGSGNQIKEGSERAFHQMKDKGYEQIQSVEGTIKDNPMRSLLAAAGIGLLIGYLISRK